MTSLSDLAFLEQELRHDWNSQTSAQALPLPILPQLKGYRHQLNHWSSAEAELDLSYFLFAPNLEELEVSLGYATVCSLINLESVTSLTSLRSLDLKAVPCTTEDAKLLCSVVKNTVELSLSVVTRMGKTGWKKGRAINTKKLKGLPSEILTHL